MAYLGRGGFFRLEGRQLERAKDFEHSLAVLLASGQADDLMKEEISDLFAQAVDRVIRHPMGDR